MPELFKLIEEKFSEVDKEWQWTYLCLLEFAFNKRVINQITITDYTWKKKGREKITRELILEILTKRINGEMLVPEPKKNLNWKRDHFVPKRVPFAGKKYKLVFWFKDGTNNHLWVKNVTSKIRIQFEISANLIQKAVASLLPLEESSRDNLSCNFQ